MLETGVRVVGTITENFIPVLIPGSFLDDPENLIGCRLNYLTIAMPAPTASNELRKLSVLDAVLTVTAIDEVPLHNKINITLSTAAERPTISFFLPTPTGKTPRMDSSALPLRRAAGLRCKLLMIVYSPVAKSARTDIESTM